MSLPRISASNAGISEHGYLVLDRSNLELRIDGDTLAVYQCHEHHGSTPLKLLERVVLQGTILLDSDVPRRLAEAGVPTIVISTRSHWLRRRSRRPTQRRCAHAMHQSPYGQSGSRH